MKITFYSSKKYDIQSFETQKKGEQYDYNFLNESLSSDTVGLSEGSDAICVFVNDVADTDIIEKLKNNGIKLILLRCAGFDNINIEDATSAGIKVMRVPMYSPYAVAEHALGLILNLNRKIHIAHNMVNANNFSLDGLEGFDIRGKTIGVIGTGHIGAIFAKMMLHGFGCTVIAYDVFESEELKTLGITYVDQNTLFKESDIISLHCPLFPTTKHIICTESIDKMKNSVMIINTSRGGLVNTQDLLDAIETEKIASFGTDVYENEGSIFFEDHSNSDLNDDILKQLQKSGKVLLTPHQAFFTKEALDQIAETTLKNISDFEKGNESHNYVT